MIAPAKEAFMTQPDAAQGRPDNLDPDRVEDLEEEAGKRQDARLDEALDETFPASDPVSSSKID